MGGWVAGDSHKGKWEAGTLYIIANYSQYSEHRNVVWMDTVWLRATYAWYYSFRVTNNIFSLVLWSNTKCLGAGSSGGIFGWSLHPQQSSRKGARGARLPMLQTGLLQTIDWNAQGCEVVVYYFVPSVRSMILAASLWNWYQWPFVALSIMFVCSILVSLRVASHHPSI